MDVTSPTRRRLRRSQILHDRATVVLAGGVSSDARRTSGTPLYVDRASGSRLWDVDGNEYVDFVLGQGPMLLGHCAAEVVEAVSTQATRGMAYSAQHELEVQAAELVTRLVPCAELVRFNTVGSEAVLGAWRIARGLTGRQRILKFEGHYHGWLDAALWSLHPPLDAAGPAHAPATVPGTGGQQASAGADVIVAAWNDIGSVRAILADHASELAAVVMEPVLCNTGCIEPEPDFMASVMRLAHDAGALVVFDEVITGFRLAAGGAQEYLGVTPDLAVFGKAMAGGLPVSAITGRAEVMDVVTRGTVGHAGTFNSNPLGMAATVATLRAVASGRDTIYPQMRALGQYLAAGIRECARRHGVPVLVDGPGPVLQTYFTDLPKVRNYRDYASTDHALAARFHQGLLERGVNIVPRGLWFLSTAHTRDDVEWTLNAVDGALADLT